ncbi:hypothetical protein [Streptomyces sp. NPDC004266]|uniref:hypothetical protein n=1 Tax=Streptomyces sp. NPDC004266 TaxID=3364693 RepID=UPI00369F6790
MFIADKVRIAIGRYGSLVRPGTGIREQGSDEKQSFVGVTFDADHSEREGGVLKWWAAIDDPDEETSVPTVA